MCGKINEHFVGEEEEAAQQHSDPVSKQTRQQQIHQPQGFHITTTNYMMFIAVCPLIWAHAVCVLEENTDEV